MSIRRKAKIEQMGLEKIGRCTSSVGGKLA